MLMRLIVESPKLLDPVSIGSALATMVELAWFVSRFGW